MACAPPLPSSARLLFERAFAEDRPDMPFDMSADVELGAVMPLLLQALPAREQHPRSYIGIDLGWNASFVLQSSDVGRDNGQ